MKLFREIEQLTEYSLNPAEILKPNPATGEDRIDIFLRKIKSGEPLELNSGKQVIIDPVQSQEALVVLATKDAKAISKYLSGNTNENKRFVDRQGNRYWLAMFQRSDDFGGNAIGTGGSVEQTNAQEAAQAVALAIAGKLGRKIQTTDLNLTNARAAKARFKVAVSNAEIKAIYKDPMWNRSIINATNALIETYPNVLNMVWYHSIGFMADVTAKFNDLNRKQGLYFSNINKWNPSDIWGTIPKLRLAGKDIDNLVEFQAWLQAKFETGEVYGVSLKKTPRKATVTKVNFDGDIDEMLNVSIQNLIVSKTNNLFNTKDTYIVYESASLGLSPALLEAEVQFRSFNPNKDIQGELKGQAASHGKIGFGGINKILQSLNLPTVTPRVDIIRMVKNAQTDHELDLVAKKIIYMARTVNPRIAEYTLQNFDQILRTLDMQRLISKFQAVEVLFILRSANRNVQESFLQELIGMASSRTSLSSVFLKVS